MAPRLPVIGRTSAAERVQNLARNVLRRRPDHRFTSAELQQRLIDDVPPHKRPARYRRPAAWAALVRRAIGWDDDRVALAFDAPTAGGGAFALRPIGAGVVPGLRMADGRCVRQRVRSRPHVESAESRGGHSHVRRMAERYNDDVCWDAIRVLVGPAQFINHACAAHANLSAFPGGELHAFVTTRDVCAGEQLLFDYGAGEPFGTLGCRQCGQ